MMRNRGFTLIELLVVISIISLLTSVVLSSLNSARLRSKDTAIKATVHEFGVLLEQDYNDTGSYSNLQKNAWWDASTAGRCTFTGGFASKAYSMCMKMIEDARGGSRTTNLLYTGTAAGDYNSGFSIMVWLPYTDAYWCYGSSGIRGIDTSGAFTTKGCYSNP